MIPAVIARNEAFFQGHGGIRLHYRSWEISRPRGAVLIVHGLSDHSGRYTELAESLARFGYSGFAVDLRGHGESEGRRGHVGRFEHFLHDLDYFRREAAGLLDPGCPLFLVGHSMGGLIVLRFIEEYEVEVRGAIVISPWLATAARIPPWKLRAAHFLNRVAPTLPMRAGLKAEDLTRQADVVRAYREDPLVHDRITPRLFVETESAMQLAVQHANRIAVPLLLLIAGADRVVRPRAALELVKHVKPSLLTKTILEDHYHELLNEPDRGLTYLQIRDWLDGRIERAAV